MSDTVGVVVRAEGLAKSFDAPAPVHALHDVSFEIHRGELVALAGPSGAGKSTLLALLGGLLTPTRGRALISGIEMSALAPEERARARCQEVGFVFQFHHLLPELTALENVALPALVASREGWRRLPLGAAAARARGLLELVGLAERAGHRPAQLSGGEAQRVAVARALMNEPAVVLADEPTGNLDRATAEELMDVLQSLNRDPGVTFLIATHNPELMARASRVLRLEGGALAAS
jgi:lipoprotein-releasing system ATP-binding protein